MSQSSSKKQPKYCLHKSNNRKSVDRAFVTIHGRRIYLGKYDSPESKDAYDRELLIWRRSQDQSAKYSTTLGQLCIAFIKHADEFYVHPDGTPTGEATNFRYAMKPLLRAYRDLPCSEFGPLKLAEIQEAFVKNHVRQQVNNHTSRVKRIFKWGVTKEMVPVEIYQAISAVEGLKRGRSKARESAPVEPVPQESIDAVLPFLTPQVAAMVRVQLLTGARPSEVRLMTVGGLDFESEIWRYQPHAHKNAWRGKSRTIFIGPQGQEILLAFIGDAVRKDQFVFRPKVAVNKAYTLHGYISSVRKACEKAQVELWSPGRLRHNTATNINREFGDIDASRVILGHSEKSTTEIYAERDLQKAAGIAKQIG